MVPRNSVNVRGYSFAFLAALSLLSGCATTQNTDEQTFVTGPLPRPGNVWVYDFGVTAADVPPESALAGQSFAPAMAPDDPQLAEDRKVGAELAAQLISQISAMGMPVQHGWSGARPRVNDLVIRGYLLSVQQGDEAERVTVGLGAGGSELKVAVEGFQMTPTGLRELGSGDVGATGSKTPGVGVGALSTLITHNPLGLIVSAGVKAEGEHSGSDTIEGRIEQTAKDIAGVLKQRFQQQGWIL